MILLGVIVLLALALAGGLGHRRKIALLFAAAGLGLLALAGSSLVAGALVDSLQGPFGNDVPPDWTSRNAIVLLGQGTERAAGGVEVGGFSQGRLLKALELYQSCRAESGRVCKLFVCGGDPQAHGEPEAAVYGRRLTALGVTLDDLVLETTSLNTWENARNVRKPVDQLRPDSIWLVTSGTHLARALLYFRHFGLDARPIRADYLAPRGGIWPNEFNLLLTSVAFHEYLGIARYHIYQKLGWNAD